MGNSQHGEVEQINIEHILEQVFKSYDEWIKNHDPEKETFQYELDF